MSLRHSVSCIWVVKHQYCIWMHIALSLLAIFWICTFFIAMLKCLLITGKGKLWRTCWDASPYCRSCGSKLLFWLSGMEVKQVLLVLSYPINISFLMWYRFSFFSFLSLDILHIWGPLVLESFPCSVDEQLAKDVQLLDSIAEKQTQVFSEECKLFPADVQIQSVYPL